MFEIERTINFKNVYFGVENLKDKISYEKLKHDEENCHFKDKIYFLNFY